MYALLRGVSRQCISFMYYLLIFPQLKWPENVSTYLAEQQPKILRDGSGGNVALAERIYCADQSYPYTARLEVEEVEDVKDIVNAQGTADVEDTKVVQEPVSPHSMRTQEPPSPWRSHDPTVGRPANMRGR